MFLNYKRVNKLKFKSLVYGKLKKNKIKKNYTRKQIQEAIAYWTNKLKIMNESSESELNVAKILRQIIIDALEKAHVPNAESLVHFIKGHPKNNVALDSPKTFSEFNIFHAGNKDSSDIYINMPIPYSMYKNNKHNIKYVGIEVKENLGSKLFNPQLSFDGSKLRYQNEYSDEMDSLELNDFEDELVPKNEKSAMIQILNGMLQFFNDLGIKIDSFPFNFKKNGYNTQSDLLEDAFWRMYDEVIFEDGLKVHKGDMSYSDLIIKYRQRKGKVRAMLTLDGAKVNDRMSTIENFGKDEVLVPTHLNVLIGQLLFGTIKSIPLGKYKIMDNHLVKSYFNTLRSKSSNYLPVQYVQYGDILYRLIDDNSIQSRFFRNNGSYKIIPYDSGFSGINVSWKLDFSEKLSESKIRIKGDITSIQNNNNAASLIDYSHCPLVTIPKNYEQYIRY